MLGLENMERCIKSNTILVYLPQGNCDQLLAEFNKNKPKKDFSCKRDVSC